MNPWLRGFLTLGIIVLIFFGAFAYARHMLTPVSESERPITVDIPVGATAGTIADRLYKAGLIRSEFAFLAFARLYGASTEMKAGEYAIPQNLGVIEIIDRLVAGDAEQQWVVIPEGKTIAQISLILEDRRLVNSGEFINAAAKKPQRYGLDVSIDRRSVEGYLMPDTYKFPKQTNERQLINYMIKNWNEKVYRPNQELFAQTGMPVDKIVIIASMIEREARVPQDRELISSVIRNRIAKKMRLDIDATVLYALGRNGGGLTAKDLKVDSPYNTRKYGGLPPGPICNPGVDSVLAALKPAQEEYLYYVAQPDGSHIFTKTYAEHRAAIARVKQMPKVSSADNG